MYTLAVQRDFIAQHYLVGGDWGAENQPHSHHYRLELRLEGDHLDQHGYLVDIVEVERQLDDLVAAHRDKMLNDLPEFAGLNPSIEHFTHIICLDVGGAAACADVDGGGDSHLGERDCLGGISPSGADGAPCRSQHDVGGACAAFDGQEEVCVLAW